MRKIDNFVNLSVEEPCPTSHLRDVGLLAVNNETVKLEDGKKELYFVENGGQWTLKCRSRQKVALIVPFRDRHEHLNIFLRHMHQFLRWQLLDYRIFVIEQADNKRFNREMLMNVGFTEARKVENFSCMVFHDVDLLPEDARNDYSCPSSPRHMSTAYNLIAVKPFLYTILTRFLVQENRAKWFQKACQIAEKLDITVQKPRTCQVQRNRANNPAETVEDHYRRNLTIPLGDHLINELETRFGSGDQETAVQCLFAVPSMLLASKETWRTSFDRFSTFHEDSLPSPLSLDAEMTLWQRKWERRDPSTVPATVAATLKEIDSGIYPNITECFKIFPTLPVTTCKCKRNVSALGRLKTYLRSTMSQTRLTGIALLHIHYNMDIDIDEIIRRLPCNLSKSYEQPEIEEKVNCACHIMFLPVRLDYKTLFGVVEGFWAEHYSQINGFPNRFWGWGGEDDDLYIRITKKQLSLTRPAQMIGRYTMLHHVHNENDPNPQRYNELAQSSALIEADGLSTLKYIISDYQERPLYTIISVSLT
ncbi:uncharacterized protein [Montipora capricornis]|uniref:uncharacterized protein n=1 Tax=Montipora capricornis TaxID=246305 RepID=UPI0035F1AF7D